MPVVFLSSHSSMRERMQGYEVGADDYLVKPFEREYLLARINVLIKYQHERQELRKQCEIARQSATIAMTSSSELGLAMRFLEKSLSYHNVSDLVHGLIVSTNQFDIDCCILVITNEQEEWYSAEGVVSPLEKELIQMCDKEARFLDFGGRTIVNYPRVSLLAKNMPLDDMDKYGRIKDVLPILLSAVNSKINVLGTQEALTMQSTNLLDSFQVIRNSLYQLGSTIVNNKEFSIERMNVLVQGLHVDFLRMGLDEDQEEYLLQHIDKEITEVMEEMDAGKEIRQALTLILMNLNSVMSKQEELLLNFSDSLAVEVAEQSSDLDDNIELF